MLQAQSIFLILTIFLSAAHSEYLVDVIEKMNCSSEISDLYCHCQLENLEKLSLNSSPDIRYKYLVVDLVFSSFNLTIDRRFFQEVSELFDHMAFEKDRSVMYEFRIKFQNFYYLSLGDHLFSNIFQNVNGRAKKHLTLNIYNSKSADVHISPQIFSNLNVTTLTVHNADLSHFTFESLFENSFIDTINFKGTYISTNPYETFKGQVNKVYLTKQASTLDSNEFPRFPVAEYIITALNVAQIDADSFSYHNNIYELNIKGDNSNILKQGDLKNFQLLRKLVLDSMTIGNGALSGPTRLEELDIQGANLESLCDILEFAMHNPNTNILLSPSLPCSCELKYFLHLKSIVNNTCYYADITCEDSQCPIVKEYYKSVIHSVPRETGMDNIEDDEDFTFGKKMTLVVTKQRGSFDNAIYNTKDRSSYITASTVYDDDKDELNTSSIKEFSRPSTNNLQADEHASNETNLYNENFESSMEHSSQHSTEHEREYERQEQVPGEIHDLEKSSKNKLNWLPIVIVTAVSVTLLLLALILYFMRRRKIKNREFKPIPSNEGLIGGGMGA